MRRVAIVWFFFTLLNLLTPVLASQQQWLAAKAQLNSLDFRQRMAAVKFLTQAAAEEEISQLLREHLLAEKNELVLALLLDYFETRHSREDFFYLLDFISLAPNYKLAGRAASIMASIHTPRTQKELAELLTQESPHFLMAFLAAFPQPDSAAREICRTALKSLPLRKAILLLPSASRNEVIGLLQPYAPFETILPEKDLTSVLLLTHLREYSGGSPEPHWFETKFTLNSSLERKLILEYLAKQIQYAPQQTNLNQLAQGSPAERYFALRQRLLTPQARHELKESLKLIASAQELFLVLQNHHLLTAEEKQLLCSNPYQSNISSLDKRLALLCTGKFNKGDITNLALFLKLQAAESSPRQLYENLVYPNNSQYRLKAVLLASEELILKQPHVFKAMLLKETNRQVRFHLTTKLNQLISHEVLE